MPNPKDHSRIEFGSSSASFETLGLAAVTGLRSMAGPALLSRAVRRGDIAGLRDTPFAALGSSKISTTLQLLMIGEMIADKTPIVPSRTSTLPLLGRALSGALVGAAFFTDAQRLPASGAVLGALCAAVAAYAGEKLREEGARRGVPNLVLGLLEDGIVLFGGIRLLRGTL